MSRQFAIERERATRGAFLLEFLNSAGPTPEQIASRAGYRARRCAATSATSSDTGSGSACTASSCPTRAMPCRSPRTSGTTSAARRPTSTATGPIRADGPRRGRGRGEQDPDRDGAEPDPLDGPLVRGPPDGDAPDGHRSADERGRRESEMPRCSPTSTSSEAGASSPASASPPTLTIVALAIRAAEHIAARLRPGRPTATPAAHRLPQAAAAFRRGGDAETAV